MSTTKKVYFECDQAMLEECFLEGSLNREDYEFQNCSLWTNQELNCNGNYFFENKIRVDINKEKRAPENCPLYNFGEKNA